MKPPSATELHPGLFDHMKRADFIRRSDGDFEQLFPTVLNMCLYFHIMFGFSNNSLVTDSAAELLGATNTY